MQEKERASEREQGRKEESARLYGHYSLRACVMWCAHCPHNELPKHHRSVVGLNVVRIGRSHIRNHECRRTKAPFHLQLLSIGNHSKWWPQSCLSCRAMRHSGNTHLSCRIVECSILLHPFVERCTQILSSIDNHIHADPIHVNRQIWKQICYICTLY